MNKENPPSPLVKGLTLNIFSSQQALNTESFLAQFILLGGFLSIFNWYLPQMFEPARQSANYKNLLELYVFWLGGNLVGYMMTLRVFRRRFRAFSGTPEVSFLCGTLIRFGLLSPIIAVALLVQGVFGRTIDKPMPKASQSFLLDLQTLLSVIFFTALCHSGYLLFKIHQGQIHWGPPEARWMLQPETPPPGQSLSLLPATPLYSPHFPSAFTMIHVYPHLSISTKYGVHAFADWQRLNALSTLISNGQLCKEKLKYLGGEVDDCFVQNMKMMGQKESFVSTLIGIINETSYRRRAVEELQKEANHNTEAVTGNLDEFMKQQRLHTLNLLAGQLIQVENLTFLCEKNNMLLDLKAMSEPRWLLPALGSVENVLLSFSVDFQRVVIREKAVPLFKNELKQIERGLTTDIRKSLAPEMSDPLDKKILELKGRLEALEKNPF